MEKLAGGVVPEVGEYNIGKRSWHNMGRVPGEGCALVDQRSRTLLYRSFQINCDQEVPKDPNVVLEADRGLC